jgi:hypothetical protein
MAQSYNMLTKAQWVDIRELYETTMMEVPSIGRRYGVHPNTIKSRIKSERWYRPVGGLPDGVSPVADAVRPVAERAARGRSEQPVPVPPIVAAAILDGKVSRALVESVVAAIKEDPFSTVTGDALARFCCQSLLVIAARTLIDSMGQPGGLIDVVMLRGLMDIVRGSRSVLCDIDAVDQPTGLEDLTDQQIMDLVKRFEGGMPLLSS